MQNDSLDLIVAMDNQGLIGCEKGLPWSLPKDLRHFRRISMDYALLMGHLTFESIGRVLDKRFNMILSRKPDYVVPGARVVHSLEEAIQAANLHGKRLLIIGGSSLYSLAWPWVRTIYLTMVDHTFCVTQPMYFPPFTFKDFDQVDCTENQPDAKHAYPFSWHVLIRRGVDSHNMFSFQDPIRKDNISFKQISEM